MTPTDIGYTAHTRAVLRLGLPLIGGHLAQFAIGLTDTIMVGWYGVPELAALAISGSFFFTLFLFGAGFAWAIMPMVATLAAQDDQVQIRRATRMALWLSGLYFAVMMPAFWHSGTILTWLGQTEEVATLGQTYLRVAGWGLLPALGVMALKSYLAGLEHTRVVLWITLAAAVANAVVNYALIFGRWGFPEMGITGAALASVAVHLVSLGLIVTYALRVLPEHQLFVRFWKPDWEMFGRVFQLGWPIGLTTLAEAGLFAGSALMIGWLGTVPLASHGVALQIASATFMVQLGLANAATIRAGGALGHADAVSLLRGARVVVCLSLAGTALAVLAFVTMPNLLLGVFIAPNEPQREAILELGRTLLMMAALFQLMDGLQVIYLGLLRGLHDTRVPMVMAALAYWGVGMPTAYVLGFPLGLDAPGVWLGLVVGLAVAAALLMGRFYRKGRGMVLRGATSPA